MVSAFCGCAADFTTKIDTRTNNFTGQPEKHLVRMYRDKKLLVQRAEVFDRKTAATHLVIEQIFFEGRRVLALIQTPQGIERTYFPESGAGIGESDKNKDGLPDFILIMNSKGGIYDALQRSTNGFLEPVSQEMLSNAKDMLPRFEQGLRELKNQDWPKDLDEEK